MYGYDLSPYVVNELRLLDEVGVFDSQTLTLDEQLSTDSKYPTTIPETVIQKSKYIEHDNIGFSLKNIRIREANMYGGYIWECCWCTSNPCCTL